MTKPGPPKYSLRDYQSSLDVEEMWIDFQNLKNGNKRRFIWIWFCSVLFPLSLLLVGYSMDWFSPEVVQVISDETEGISAISNVGITGEITESNNIEEAGFDLTENLSESNNLEASRAGEEFLVESEFKDVESKNAPDKKMPTNAKNDNSHLSYSSVEVINESELFAQKVQSKIEKKTSSDISSLAESSNRIGNLGFMETAKTDDIGVSLRNTVDVSMIPRSEISPLIAGSVIIEKNQLKNTVLSDVAPTLDKYRFWSAGVTAYYSRSLNRKTTIDEQHLLNTTDHWTLGFIASKSLSKNWNFGIGIEYGQFLDRDDFIDDFEYSVILTDVVVETIETNQGIQEVRGNADVLETSTVGHRIWNRVSYMTIPVSMQYRLPTSNGPTWLIQAAAIPRFRMSQSFKSMEYVLVDQILSISEIKQVDYEESPLGIRSCTFFWC